MLADGGLWETVREAYLDDTPTRDPQLEKEIKCLREAMNAFRQPHGGATRVEPLSGTDVLRPPPAGRYVVVGFLGVGGAGIVFKVWDTTLRTYRALKISRPIEGKEDLVAALLSQEISRLQEVSHPNVISIFDAGVIPSSQGPLPFYTMTFLRDSLPAHKFFAKQRTMDELLEFVRGLLAGVAHLHSRSLVHLDIKPNNVFVGEAGYSVVADLGGARQLTGNPTERLVVTCTTTFAHPELLTLTAVSSAGDDNRRRGHPLRSDLKFAFDLYATGRTLLKVTRAFENASPHELAAYSRKYLALLSARLLDGHVESTDRPLGLTEASLRTLKYENTAEAVTDLDKLLGRVNLLSEIPELSPSSEDVIQVTRGEKTNFTERLESLLKQPLLRRLGSISQLGLVRMVYPGATHTRLEHSLGTFSNAAQYITALYNDPINPLFRQIVRAEDLVATLLAALLHDLGQYQHAHDLNDVEPKVFRHDTLTSSLLKKEDVRYQHLTVPLVKELEDEWHVSASRILAILETDPERLSTNIRDRLLHTLVSGPLDADKLDYLIRDSVQCQTVFGRGIDRSRLLGTLTVVYERQGEKEDQFFALGIHEKGRAAAESVAFARYQMFRAVYWHHAVRAAKAMLQRAAYEWMASRKSAGNDALKSELYEFVLELPRRGSSDLQTQQDFFESGVMPFRGRVGYAVRPQWATVTWSDLVALEWLHERTTPTGQRLLSMIATRDLYKRVLVVSASQNAQLWSTVERNTASHEKLHDLSEDLRDALAEKLRDSLQQAIDGKVRYHVTGLGDPTDSLTAAAAALKLDGTVLIDVPERRGGEVLRFYPEELHRRQREDFEESTSLGISEVWKLSQKLHENAGNIRVFVHPHIDVLRRARRDRQGEPLLPAATIEAEMRKIFGLTASSSA